VGGLLCIWGSRLRAVLSRGATMVEEAVFEVGVRRANVTEVPQKGTMYRTAGPRPLAEWRWC
jgi:hypothetical protein